jgi:hypothetical protein
LSSDFSMSNFKNFHLCPSTAQTREHRTLYKQPYQSSPVYVHENFPLAYGYQRYIASGCQQLSNCNALVPVLS